MILYSERERERERERRSLIQRLHLRIFLFRYFSVVGGGNDIGWEELESQRGEYVLAHNGWVMNADPLVNFAAEGTTVTCMYTCMQHTCMHMYM